MTNEELRTKIVEILEETEYEWTEEKNGYILQIFYDKLADVLIAAGYGDVKRHRVFVSKDGKEVKQFYSGEEVENILKERNELKVELRDKVDYIHEQDEVIKEYKHRAEVAARMAKRACDIVFSQEIESEEWDEAIFNYKKDKGIREIGITPNILYDYLKAQAEKELAEERKE